MDPSYFSYNQDIRTAPLIAPSESQLDYSYGLGQDCSNSSALAMESLQSCTEPLIDGICAFGCLWRWP